MSYHNLPLQAIIDPIQLVLKRQHNFYLNIQHKVNIILLVLLLMQLGNQIVKINVY
jgi:hypothetical protein